MSLLLQAISAPRMLQNHPQYFGIDLCRFILDCGVFGPLLSLLEAQLLVCLPNVSPGHSLLPFSGGGVSSAGAVDLFR